MHPPLAIYSSSSRVLHLLVIAHTHEIFTGWVGIHDFGEGCLPWLIATFGCGLLIRFVDPAVGLGLVAVRCLIVAANCH